MNNATANGDQASADYQDASDLLGSYKGSKSGFQDDTDIAGRTLMAVESRAVSVEAG